MGISPLVQPLKRRQNMKRTLLTWLVLDIGLSLSSALPHPGAEQSGAEKMKPLSKMEPLHCPMDGLFGLPKLMELGKGIYCSNAFYACYSSEPIVGRCFSDDSFDPVEETCSFTKVYCEMDSEKVYKWNKPCQTDYFNQTLHSNDTRYEFCYYGYVFDPIRNHCVRLKETECSQDLCDYYWPYAVQCESVSTTTEPTHPTTHPTTDPTTQWRKRPLRTIGSLHPVLPAQGRISGPHLAFQLSSWVGIRSIQETVHPRRQISMLSSHQSVKHSAG